MNNSVATLHTNVRVVFMLSFLSNIVLNFFIALGVVLGGSVFGALAAVLTGQPPLKTMIDVADSIKIWAIAVALGGTFSSFRVLEQGLFKGEIKSLIRQLLYIFFAMGGAQLGYVILYLIKGRDIN
ncbi:MAG: YtrH family sporulation protein [Clostridia bacterium]